MWSAARRIVSRKFALRNDGDAQERQSSPPMIRTELAGEGSSPQVDQPRLRNKRSRLLRTPSLTPPREISPTLQVEPDMTSASVVKMEQATKGSSQKAEHLKLRIKRSRLFRILSPSPPLESSLAVEVVDTAVGNAEGFESRRTVQEPMQELRDPRTKEERDRLVRALFTPPPSGYPSTRPDTPSLPSSSLTPRPSENQPALVCATPPPLTGSSLFPWLDDVPVRVADDDQVAMPQTAGVFDANTGATKLANPGEVERWIGRWVKKGKGRGVAEVDAAGVDPIYAKSKDILDRPATRQLCLLLAVQAELQQRYSTILWPDYTPHLCWSAGDITRLRSFLRILNEPPRLTEAGKYACQECTGGRWIGHLRVPCIYDPVAMDGCVGCKTREASRRGVCCHFDVQAANHQCVRWDKEAAENEQAAFEALPLIVPEDASDLLAIIQRESDGVPAAFPIAFHVERFFSPDYGLLTSFDALLAARASLRVSTCKGEPYLVWSWRHPVDEEQGAYEAVRSRIREWNRPLVEKHLRFLTDAQPECAQIVRDAVQRLASSFEEGGEFARAFGEYAAAREARNESRQ